MPIVRLIPYGRIAADDTLIDAPAIHVAVELDGANPFQLQMDRFEIGAAEVQGVDGQRYYCRYQTYAQGDGAPVMGFCGHTLQGHRDVIYREDGTFLHPDMQYAWLG